MATPCVEISEITPYFGYIYMWCDMEKNMFYIGSHKGSIFDRYKSGSKWLNNAIRKRPKTLKMIILEYYYGENRQELYDIETKWLKFHNVENNKHFYNFKNTAAGGSGPSPLKGKKRSEYIQDWIDPRKGKKCEDIYSEPEKYRSRLVEILKNEYNKNGVGRKRGKKHSKDARKGKTVEEIYGYRRLANPEKPFIITIYEKFLKPYEIYCNNEREFHEKIKMDYSTLKKLKKFGKKEILRIHQDSKHCFNVGTTLELKFIQQNTK